jgi:hypothetical protein
MEVEDHPDEPAKARRAPVGLAVLIRIPKLDARHGFRCYLDEVQALEPYRQRGV